MKKGEKGITLISLIVMIIILLILAGITLGTINSEDGIITQAGQTVHNAQKESIIEKIEADLYNEKVKTGKVPSKQKLEEIVSTYYGRINNENNKIITNQGNYEISFMEIEGWCPEHKEIEYIESTGSQWIDTEYKLTSNSKVEIEFEITSKENMCIFGSRESAEKSNFGIFFDNYYVLDEKYGLVIDFDNYLNNRLVLQEEINKKIKVIQSKEELIVVNERNHINVPVENFTTSQSAYIFYISNNQPYAGAYAKMKLYSCKIWEDGDKKRDFIPVLDKNSIACLYDKVEGKYYYNANQGETEEFKY